METWSKKGFLEAVKLLLQESKKLLWIIKQSSKRRYEIGCIMHNMAISIKCTSILCWMQEGGKLWIGND